MEIAGGTELKLLGFWFGNKPNVDVHVTKMCNKFRSRLWALRHLKMAGMDSEDLRKIYLSVLRPVLDFASPTYHPLLSKTQTYMLEALQKRAAKVIFGTERSYSDIISSGDLQLLEERRRNLCLSFAKKTACSERFGAAWFPKRPKSIHDTRKPERYQENKVGTERMKKNPINYMLRELNKL